MSIRRLVHPELLPTLEAFPGFELSVERLEVIRAAFNNRPVEDAPDVAVTNQFVERGDGARIRVLHYAPSEVQGVVPALLHIHGGGYVMGVPEMVDQQSKAFVRSLGCAVFSVDYRVAPETAFPGAVEDCHAALVWLFKEAERLGVDRRRIAIGGESAGGGLAAALGLLNRDRTAAPLRMQYLTYPMLDYRTGLGGAHIYDPVATWTAENNRFGWDALLGEGFAANEVSPYASPSNAKVLSDLPPTFIAVGALDLFAAECADYAVRLLLAGVPTEFHIYPGAYHGFNQVAQATTTARFNADLFGALREAFRL
jgi:acetyl esterase/lipase